MKTNFITFLFILATITIQSQVKTPAPSPSAKISQAIGLTDVSVDYSRPAVRGRTIYGDLVPYGKVWRTGANAKTKITFSTDVSIDGKELKSGTYALFTIPNADSWEIVFYTDYDGGGAPSELDESKVALKTTVKPENLPFETESFTIGFGDLADPNSGMLYIMWASTSVGIKIDVPTDKITMASIDDALAGPSSNDYFSAATYYFDGGKDLNKAKEWVDKAVEMRKEPAFWQLRQQSLIYAALGDKKGAIKAAKKSLELSKTASNDDYIKMNTESITEWSN